MRRIALLGLLVALAACSDSTGPNGSVVGSYQLRTINGSSLPYTFDSGSGTATLQSDVLTLNADGTYDDTGNYSSSQGTTQLSEQGTWSNNNGAITFYDQTDGGITYQGSVSGTVLTEIVDQYTEVYQKR